MTGLILVAAGSGTRFGSSVPKQFLQINGKRIFLYSLENLAVLCAEIVVPVPEEWIQQVHDDVSKLKFSDRIKILKGGSSRQNSVIKGLKALSPKIEKILIHDSVRPWASRSLAQKTLEGLNQNSACIPVLPISETIKEIDNDFVLRTLERSQLRLSQTPQAFLRTVLEQALAQASQQGSTGTDEAALVERTGEKVAIMEGEHQNIKITWREDLYRSGLG